VNCSGHSTHSESGDDDELHTPKNAHAVPWASARQLQENQKEGHAGE
jgi:hypothetical protein